MDYKQGKVFGEPVGSGVVESTARQYQTRFNAPVRIGLGRAMKRYWRWLPTLYRNERWHLLFSHAQSVKANSSNRP